MLLAVASWLIGAFLRYETFRPIGLAGKPFSISVYGGLRSGEQLTFFGTLALTAALGCAIALRPHRIRTAFAGGFCVTAAEVAAYMTAFATRNSGHLGMGFYVTLAGAALEAVVAVSALVVVATGSPDARPASSRTIGLAIVAAVVIGTSTSLRSVSFRGLALGSFTPLSFRSGAAATIAFAAVATVLVLAVRIRGRVGSALLLGLAATEIIIVLDALIQRFGSPGTSPLHPHLTIGWWGRVVAVAMMLVLAQQLRATRAPQPGVADETAPLPA